MDPLPFSACELGATVLIVGALAFLVEPSGVRLRAKKVPCPPGCCMWRCWSSGGLCGRVRTLGHPVLRYKLAGRAGMQSPAVSVEQLAAVTDYFAARVNETADAVPRDESSLFAVEKTEICKAAPACTRRCWSAGRF